MSDRLEGKVPKGWGYELIWATNDKYCGKIMVFENFYKYPDKIRKFALEQEYKVVGNYPGKRTESFRKDYHKKMFEKILLKVGFRQTQSIELLFGASTIYIAKK